MKLNTKYIPSKKWGSYFGGNPDWFIPVFINPDNSGVLIVYIDINNHYCSSWIGVKYISDIIKCEYQEETTVIFYDNKKYKLDINRAKKFDVLKEY